ncbi:hypothetical protein K2173_028475 [Erythroxylum novogranatense]|uniref:RNA helicase n=1 Tax=Erythroxylum novogranatense TaxID=1862640 RepID=A0AAV8U614_9ROSI|nr:hypothetical protein K2173_028475 [Erythroxylum novogranatense]
MFGGDALASHLHRIRQGVELIVGTPGRLIDLLMKHDMNLDDIMMFVLNEVDCMFQRVFRDQVLIYSTTISVDIKKMANSLVKDIISLQQKYTFRLAIWVESKQKMQKLFDILMSKQHFNPPAIIYMGSKLGADLLSNAITLTTGLKALSIHGEKSMKERREVIKSFLLGEVHVIISTGVLGRRVDLLRVRQVIIFDMPNNIKEYVHQIGRASQIGEEGTAIILVIEENKNLFPELIECLRSSRAILPWELVNSRYDVCTVFDGKGHRKLKHNF